MTADKEWEMYHKRWSDCCLLTVVLVSCLLSCQPGMAQQVLDSESLDPSDSHPTGAGKEETLTQPFNRQWLHEHARELAARAYRHEAMDENNPLRSLDYNDYRRIAFDPDDAIWAGENRRFNLNLFHPGFLYTLPVKIHLVSEGTARRLPFTTEVFDYADGLGDIGQANAEEYAGFRVHYPINTPERAEEFLVFLGTSYFRAVGRNQLYGLSARGLALNTVGPGGEEFPRFSEFWIERPAVGAQEIVIHALLDSPSVTGAYHFSVVPGDSTRIEVDARLYPRQEMERVGIAPLTSMFLFDARNRVRFDDFRNAVHDSGGLYILQDNGEHIWRPLANPEKFQASFFGGTMPVAFGLLQRHQDFEDFNDDEARYDKRPSLWIEPLGDWGSGHVVLVEIPTEEEVHDNIVAYWQPAASLKADREYRFQYRMYWGSDSAFAPAQGRILSTSVGAVTGSEERLFVIDYSEGRKIPDVGSDPEAVHIRASTSAGIITEVSGTLVEASGDYRAYVKFDPEQSSLAELRVTLDVEGQQWGETWLYRWTE